jgi:putative SOS response-associated peptidase YedK
LAVQARNGRVADKPEVNDHYASFVLDEPHPPLEEWLRSFTIITTKPNELTTVYHRMPVILYPEDYDERLIRVDGEDPQANLLRPYPAEEMKAKEVLNDLRNVSNNHPELLNSCLMRIHV